VQNHSFILKKVNFNCVKVLFLFLFVWQYGTETFLKMASPSGVFQEQEEAKFS
jgi:hypothetical protein